MLLSVVIILVVVGILLWAINQYVPMDAAIKKILNIVVILVVILWLIKVFGLFDYLAKVHV